MTVQPTRDQLSKRAGHILFTQGPEQPAATAHETVILLDQLAAAEARIRDLTQEVRDERGAALDQMEQVRIRDARIEAVRELHSESRIIPGTPVFGCAECGEPNETEPCATIRALEG